MSDKETEEKVDTRPRRPRRQRSQEEEPAPTPEPQAKRERDHSESQSQAKVTRDRDDEGQGAKESQAKPRRKRREALEEDEAQGDGGWMGSSESRAKKFEPDPEPEKDVMALQNKDKHFNEDVNDIMIIPDLDEDGGGDSDARVAHAPRNVSRKIPNLNTLQNEAKNSLQTNKDGIDLSILLGTLVPPDMLVEEDTLWTFDSLLREVTEELNTAKSAGPVKKQ